MQEGMKPPDCIHQSPRITDTQIPLTDNGHQDQKSNSSSRRVLSNIRTDRQIGRRAQSIIALHRKQHGADSSYVSGPNGK